MRPDLLVDLLPDGSLSVAFPYDPFVVDFIRQVPGRRWRKEMKFWAIPSPALRDLRARAASLGIGVALTERVQQAFALGGQQRGVLEKAKTDDRPLDIPSPTEAKPYQRAGVRYLQRALKNFKGALLADDLGIGKSYQALAVVARNETLQRVLVLCPATIKYVWAGQIDEHFPQLSYTIINGSAADREEQWAAPTRVKIANYELLVARHKPDCPRSNAKKRRENRSAATCVCGTFNDQTLFLTEWDLVIADEISACKNFQAERTKRTKRLRRRYSLGLSGLPIENRLEELHSIMDFVMPGLLGPGWLFVQQHVVRNQWGKVLGYRGIEQIKERIAPYYLRRRKADVLKELPPKVYSDLPLELSDEQWAQYDAVRRQIVDAISENPKLSADNILVMMLRLKQVTSDPRVLATSGKPGAKHEAFADLLAEAGDHKIVAFTQFAQVARLWAEDFSLPIIEGDVPIAERADIIKDFQAGRWPALISTGAGAYGVTLSAADICVHVDQEWNPAKMRQREDRLHRLGQTASVQVVTLMARRTIDDGIRKLLHRKWAVAAAIFDEADLEQPPALTRAQLLEMLGVEVAE